LVSTVADIVLLHADTDEAKLSVSWAPRVLEDPIRNAILDSVAHEEHSMVNAIEATLVVNDATLVEAENGMVSGEMNKDRATGNSCLPGFGVHRVNLLLSLHHSRVFYLRVLFAGALAKFVWVITFENWLTFERSEPGWDNIGSPATIATVIHWITVEQVLLRQRI